LSYLALKIWLKNFARRQIPTAIFVGTTLSVKLFGHNKHD